MFVFEISGGETTAADTQQRVAAIESAVIDAVLLLSALESDLVDAQLLSNLLEADLVDTQLLSNLLEADLVDTQLLALLSDSLLFDSRTAISATEFALVDTRIFNPSTSFVHALGSVMFPWPPQRPQRRLLSRAQLREHDSAAAAYVYGKSLTDRAELQLVFSRVDTATLQILLTWVRSSVRGSAEPFVWIDHNKTAHSVRLRSPRINHRQTGPDRHQVEIALEEDLV